MRTVLTIAGSDSSGGAGIQADVRTISACGGYGATVLTAITAQNTRGVVQAQEIPLELVAAQLDAVFDDLRVDAVKSGMLASSRMVRAVARCLHARRPRHYVLDPVMVAKSGHALLDPDAIAALRQELLPLATLVTPNLHEAEKLTDVPIRSVDAAERAGRKLLEHGCRAALVKGGHLDGDDAADVLVTPGHVHVFATPRIDTPHTHGTGCTYSAAIATFLARGATLPRAVGLAKLYVTEAIRDGLPLGDGYGPTDHFFYLRRPDTGAWLERLRVAAPVQIGRLHVITDETLQTRFTHLQLARQAVDAGADVVQLREKRGVDIGDKALAIRELCGARAQLVIDDRVDVARDVDAFGVHLGPNDMPVHDARRALGPIACIGGTANSLQEARTLFDAPLDYLGVGPVYGTTSKANPAPVLGVEALRAIAAESPVPVIAIGGIRPEDVAEVLAAGAHGVAVLSGVVCAADPARATAAYRAAVDAALDASPEASA